MNPKEKLLTKRGYEELMNELQDLVRVQRPKTLQGIADAAAEGDRSENAEYIYGRKRLREMDKQIRRLDSLLDGAKIVDPLLLSGDKVCFGATVTVCIDEEKTSKWTIVGEGEGGADGATISYRSPVARALLGKLKGDEVEIERPSGFAVYEILEVEFDYGD